MKQIVFVPKKTKSMRKNGNYSLFLELVKKKIGVCQPQKEGREGHFPATFGRVSTKDSPAFEAHLIPSDPFSGHGLLSTFPSARTGASAVSETQLHFPKAPRSTLLGRQFI